MDIREKMSAFVNCHLIRKSEMMASWNGNLAFFMQGKKKGSYSMLLDSSFKRGGYV